MTRDELARRMTDYAATCMHRWGLHLDPYTIQRQVDRYLDRSIRLATKRGFPAGWLPLKHWRKFIHGMLYEQTARRKQLAREHPVGDVDTLAGEAPPWELLDTIQYISGGSKVIADFLDGYTLAENAVRNGRTVKQVRTEIDVFRGALRAELGGI